MIAERLKTGYENPTSSKELCETMDIDTRSLRWYVAIERKGGKPICARKDSEKGGYFLAGNKDEMRMYCRSIEHQIKELRDIHKACKKAIAKLPD